ncbi:MAG TPA: dicarboxylate/amino acid:cation symporter [Candidatus Angelobacter sp.]|jgi:Na+/H+-dicarboxylate symporter|nr:dicarboxylate/amino acid:cation symporter [Candidatus Angelobacter sp.]
MSLILRVAIGLVAGLLLGVGISSSHSGWLARIPGFLDPVGAIFVNAIRLAVIPIVFSGLIAGTASGGSPRKMGKLGGRALALILIILVASALAGLAVSWTLFSRLNLDKNVVSSLTEKAFAPSASQASYPSIAQWFIDLVPANVFKAAAEGALLPLIVVSIGFGLALTQVESQRRAVVVQFFQGIRDAFLGLVSYVLKLAPIGVFALAVPLAARLGIAAVGALAYYIAIFSGACTAFILLILYPTTLLFGRVSLSRFTKASLPAQAVAFTSRSSLASLPAAYEGVRVGLGLPEEIQNFFLPIAASIFRAGAPMAQIIGVLFLAKLYGVVLHPVQLATVVVTVIATSLTAPGIPGGSIIVMAPVLASANIPVAGVGILLAIDTIPDMFRTTANVTGWLSVASVLGRSATATQSAGSAQSSMA